MGCDVIVIGEPLLEFSATRPLTEATTFELSFSGDALNAAVAAAAAGARTALLTRLGRDELSDRLVGFMAERGVDPALIRRADGRLCSRGGPWGYPRIRLSASGKRRNQASTLRCGRG
jgi:sugar/nucleoside kinase (ribokinase family)